MIYKTIIAIVLISLLHFSTLFSQPNANAPMGMNLHGVGDGTCEMIFQDIFKSSRSKWISQDASNGAWEDGPTPLNLDENGWLISLENSDHYVTKVIQNIPDRYIGHHHVFYDGKGTFNFWGAASYVDEPEPGHIIVDLAETGTFFLDITETDPDNTGNYIRNIEIIPESYLSTYQTETFTPRFLELWEEFKVIRFMDWLHTNNSTIDTWESRTDTNYMTQAKGGVAHEYIIEFCNLTQQDPWICIPHLADDNYVSKCAELYKDNLDPGLTLYVEYSNEVWNGQFDQAVYAGNAGVDSGYAAETHAARPLFYAKRSCQVFDIFETVFGGTDRIERVLAWQNFSVSGTRNVLTFEVAPGDTAYEHCDFVAIAPYFGSFLGSNQTDTIVDDYSEDYMLDILEHTVAKQTNQVRAQYDNVHSYINDKGNEVRLIAYEGGQHLVGTFGAENNTQLQALFHAVNRHERMGDIYWDYYSRWKLAGGEMFAVFSSMGNWSKWGSWGILEDYSGVNIAPKYNATVHFNEANQPPWWISPETEPTIPEGDLIVNFTGTDIPSGCTFNRSWTSPDANTKYAPFSTADGDNLFSCSGFPMGEFYGGFWLESEDGAVIIGKEPSLDYNDDQFEIYLGAGENIQSKHAGCFMWRKDMFLNGYDLDPNVTIGKIKFTCSSLFGEVRFIVKNGSQYYISDWVTNQNGTYELTLFDNSDAPEKRWKEWTPKADTFDVPYPIAGTHAVSFDDVQEVGIVYENERNSWGNGWDFSEFKVWTRDNSELSTTINLASGQNNPAASSPVNYTVTFNQSVTDFDQSDVSISGSAQPTTVVVTETGPMDGTTYNVAISGMSYTGSVIADIAAGVASNGFNQNLAATSRRNALQYNIADPPTVTIEQAPDQDDPDLSTGNVRYIVTFSEAVTGFTEQSDVTLSGTAGASAITINEISPNDGTTFEVLVSGMTQDGTVVAEIPAGAVNNAPGAANTASTSTDNMVNWYNSDPPQVTINQAAAQSDPSFASNVHFSVVFNQSVSGFDNNDVVVSGTALPTAASVTEISPLDGTTYNVEVSGMTSDGSVIAEVKANAAQNSESEWNLSSTSTDNEVEFRLNMPSGGQIVYWNCDNVTSTTTNRTWISDGTRLYMPFTTEADSNIFTTGESQSEFYGGIEFDWAPNPENGFNYCRINTNDDGWEPNRYVMGAGTAGNPTNNTSLFMWKKEQFLNNMDAVNVGFNQDTTESILSLRVHNSNGATELRFIIRNGSTYYISEWEAQANWNFPTQVYTLKGFNNSVDPGKRWGVFNPTENDFTIPGTDPVYEAVDFNDVTEVGFIHNTSRTEYLNSHHLDSFLVFGIAVIPKYDVTFTVDNGVNPVSGAEVNFNSETGTTDGSGSITFTDVLVGMAKPYSITAADFQTASGNVNVVDQDVPVNVTLDSIGAGTYSVTFAIDDGTSPIEGAQISFNSQNISTNASGEAVFAGVAPASDIVYTITYPGFDTETDSVDVTNQNVNLPVTMTETTYHLAVTNGIGSGNYLPATNIQVIADAPSQGQVFTGWTGDTQFLDDPDNDTAEITMPTSDVSITASYASLKYDVTFLVTDGTLPVENASVDFNTQQKPTDAAGSTTFSLIDGDSTYSFTISATGYSPESGSFYLQSGDTTIDIALTDTTTHTVTFYVTDGSTSLEGATVDFDSRTISTDTAGNTIFLHVMSGNDLAYSVQLSGYETYTGNLNVNGDELQAVVLIPGDVAVKEVQKDLIWVYPNPVSDILYFESTENIKYVELMDMSGRIIQKITINSQKGRINANNLSKGIYLLKLTNTSSVFKEKIVIQ